MPCAHATASGMCGMRAAGDLVARMQITRGLRLGEAKAYVAERLGVSPFDLSDPVAMEDVRRERQASGRARACSRGSGRVRLAGQGVYASTGRPASTHAVMPPSTLYTCV